MDATFASYLSRLRDALDMFLWRLPFYRPLLVPTVDLTGKNAIITGANTGIGLESARKLAAFGANVTLACRSVEKGEEANKDIVATTGSDQVRVRVLDLSSFASVRAFVTEWGAKPVDILMNNAGMTPGRYLITSDGLEQSYQVNHLAHFLLTSLLLPVLASHARVVNVSSYMHYFGSPNPDDLDRSQLFKNTQKLVLGDPMNQEQLEASYAVAKCSQIAFTRELQVLLDASEKYREKKIIVSSCHPGCVASSIWERHRGTSEGLDKTIDGWSRMVNMIGITTEQGACTQTWLATDPALAVGGGKYHVRCKVSAPNPLVEDAVLRKKLWAAWSAACGVSGEI